MKELYNETFFKHFSKRVEEVYPAFDTPQFLNLIYDHEWEQKELKQRMRTITHALRATLPSSYAEALDILFALSPRCRGLEYLFFPDFVEVYGRDDWDLSITALEHFTSSSSSEFAVRPFIEANPEKMMAVMQRWAEHEDHHVRRLASEGCRPRLPWAKPLNRFKKDPAPILPILESLKADPSEYVRRSVANNLNDISKDHPDLVKRLSGEWKGRHPHTDWIIKHGCRTLLKKGDAEVLSLFGFETEPDVNVRNLSLSDNTLSYVFLFACQ